MAYKSAKRMAERSTMSGELANLASYVHATINYLACAHIVREFHEHILPDSIHVEVYLTHPIQHNMVAEVLSPLTLMGIIITVYDAHIIMEFYNGNDMRSGHLCDLRTSSYCCNDKLR